MKVGRNERNERKKGGRTDGRKERRESKEEGQTKGKKGEKERRGWTEGRTTKTVQKEN